MRYRLLLAGPAYNVSMLMHGTIFAMKPRLFFLISAYLLWFCTPVHAELADRNKPMHIEADAMRYDDIGKTTSATGRVIASKGTLLLRADAIEIRQDTQGQNFMIATGSAGNPVFMRQKREGLNEFFEAQANRIERDEKTQMIRLIGKAVLRRLVSNALADEIQGETVIYNEATEAYTVASGAAGGVSTSGIPSGRVRAMITPRSATTASSARGRNSTSGPAVPLQPSPQIGANHE